MPSSRPTDNPTRIPTHTPSKVPSKRPSVQPSVSPSKVPSRKPSVVPSYKPTTSTPTSRPSSRPTSRPSVKPTVTPTKRPSKVPTKVPSVQPSFTPTKIPTYHPTVNPSVSPSYTPSMTPTYVPSYAPSFTPTKIPSKTPTFVPSAKPTFKPTFSPSVIPTFEPTLPFPCLPGEIDFKSPTEIGRRVGFCKDYNFTGSNVTVQLCGYDNQNKGIQFDGYQPIQMYEKNLDGDEQGLGLVSDITLAHEITTTGFIQLDVRPLRHPTLFPYFSMGSVNSLEDGADSFTSTSFNEWYELYGCNTPGDMTRDPDLLLFSNNVSRVGYPLPGVYDYDYICFTASNVTSIFANVLISKLFMRCDLVPIITYQPSIGPTRAPSRKPSSSPSVKPTYKPTKKPTLTPSSKPSVTPTFFPSDVPTYAPSVRPITLSPSFLPSKVPSRKPSIIPSFGPSTLMPTATFACAASDIIFKTDNGSDQQLGVCQDFNFTGNNVTVQLCGYDNQNKSIPLNGYQPVNMYIKNERSTPNDYGLGLTSDETLANEITTTGFIQMNTKPLRHPNIQIYYFMGSTNNTEYYEIYGCNTPGNITRDPEYLLYTSAVAEVGYPLSLSSVYKYDYICFTASNRTGNYSNVLISALALRCGKSEPVLTWTPTQTPTAPTKTPTYKPTFKPSLFPSKRPTMKPSSIPIHTPTFAPSKKPTLKPSSLPTVLPTFSPSEFTCRNDTLNFRDANMKLGYSNVTLPTCMTYTTNLNFTNVTVCGYYRDRNSTTISTPLFAKNSDDSGLGLLVDHFSQNNREIDFNSFIQMDVSNLVGKGNIYFSMGSTDKNITTGYSEYFAVFGSNTKGVKADTLVQIPIIYSDISDEFFLLPGIEKYKYISFTALNTGSQTPGDVLLKQINISCANALPLPPLATITIEKIEVQPQSSSNSVFDIHNTGVLVGISVGGACLCFICCIFLFFGFYKQKAKKNNEKEIQKDKESYYDTNSFFSSEESSAAIDNSFIMSNPLSSENEEFSVMSSITQTRAFEYKPRSPRTSVVKNDRASSSTDGSSEGGGDNNESTADHGTTTQNPIATRYSTTRKVSVSDALSRPRMNSQAEYRGRSGSVIRLSNIESLPTINKPEAKL